MKIALLSVAVLAGVAAQARDHEARLAAAQAQLQEAAEEVAVIVKENVHWRSDSPFLGVWMSDQSEQGLLIAGVSPDSGAEAAGLKADDLIVAINDQSLRGKKRPLRVLRRALKEVDAGDSVALRVVRDDEEREFIVVTAPFSWAERLPMHWLDDDWYERVRAPFVHLRRSIGDGGLHLVDVGEDLGAYFGVDAGVLVVDTPAKSELKPGDILKRIDDAAVASAKDAYRLLRSLDEKAPVQVRRKNRKVTVDVSPRSWRSTARFRHHDRDDVEVEKVIVTKMGDEDDEER